MWTYRWHIIRPLVVFIEYTQLHYKYCGQLNKHIEHANVNISLAVFHFEGMKRRWTVFLSQIRGLLIRLSLQSLIHQLSFKGSDMSQIRMDCSTTLAWCSDCSYMLVLQPIREYVHVWACVLWAVSFEGDLQVTSHSVFLWEFYGASPRWWIDRC